jgi:hypothetical protein
MSDRSRSDAMPDRLHDTLTSLRTDIDGVPLADSAAVRRRGNQRTRRQAVGSSLAVVALVAGAVGIGGALVGENKAEQMPAPQPTITTTDKSPGPVEQVPVTPAVLLEADELPEVPNQTFSIGETIEGATKADADERGLTVCAVSPSSPFPDANEKAILRTFPSELDAYAWQWVAQYANELEAKATMSRLNFPCTGRPGYQNQFLGEPFGTTFRSTHFTAEPDSEYFGEFVGIAYRGDTVIVVGLRGNLREGEVDQQAFNEVFLEAVDRVAKR